MEGEMLEGHLDMIVLAAMVDGPTHGYGIMQEIKRGSGGAFALPEGTIYPTLHRLESAGYLASHWTTAKSGRKRRVYKMTRRGERALSDHRALWQRFADAIGGLFGEKAHAPARTHR
jgi:PadR family transcriptional regulator, regulatory protein PadR